MSVEHYVRQMTGYTSGIEIAFENVLNRYPRDAFAVSHSPKRMKGDTPAATLRALREPNPDPPVPVGYNTGSARLHPAAENVPRCPACLQEPPRPCRQQAPLRLPRRVSG